MSWGAGASDFFPMNPNFKYKKKFGGGGGGGGEGVG